MITDKFIPDGPIAILVDREGRVYLTEEQYRAIMDRLDTILVYLHQERGDDGEETQ